MSKLTFTFIFKVWEVNHLLREDIQAKPPASVCLVIDVSRISHYFLAFVHDHSKKNPIAWAQKHFYEVCLLLIEVLNLPNKSSLGSVNEMPSVGGEVLPPNVLGVVPQSTHLKVQNWQRSKWELNQTWFGRDSKSLLEFALTCPGVSPVCHRAFLKCSPGPVVELTTLIDRPE